MALATEAPNENFRLSMLIYDTRYRALTIQIVVLILFGLGVAWLLNNTAQNLAVKGKEFNYSFLGSRAGYDIAQALIPYTNDSSHFRAMLVGLVNTLVLAILGCILATVVGVVVGILRLSKNWLVARLMTVYVEIFRNIPLLLWILFIFVPLTELTPSPNAFKLTPEILANRQIVADAHAAEVAQGGLFARIADISFSNANFLLWLLLSILLLTVAVLGARQVRSAALAFGLLIGPAIGAIVLSLIVFSADMSGVPDVPEGMVVGPTEAASQMFFSESVAFTNRGTYMPFPVLDAPLPQPGWLPINATFLAIVVVLAGSLFANARILLRARTVQEATGVRPTTWWQSLLVLFGPIFTLLWVVGFHLDYPQPPTRFNFEGGILVPHPFLALLIALTLYTGAFIAEIVRAGILAISRGQTEASFALGLKPSWTMNLVILPQALRVIIPPLISQYLNLTKNTSLGIAVSYLDLRGTLGGITLNQTGRELECMLLMMLIYLTISLIISTLMNIYNRSVRLKER